MPRRLVLALGTDPAATGLLADVLRELGVHRPGTRPVAAAEQPGTVPAGEPDPFVADWHDRLLEAADVAPDDPRPTAWLAAAVGGGQAHGRLTDALRTWLADAWPADRDELVVADPRAAWAVEPWRTAATSAGAEVGAALVVAPPPADVGAAGAWLTRALGAERATRDLPRAVLSLSDLVDDWTVPVARVGERLGLAAVRGASATGVRRVAHRLAPAPRPAPGAGSPPWLAELLDGTAAALRTLEETDDEAARARLDDLRTRWSATWAAAEALVGR